MKLFSALIILFFLSNCSFDDKSGIWKNEDIITKDSSNIFKEFKTISTSQDTFNKVFSFEEEFKIKLPLPIKNSQWEDIYYGRDNNLKNFKYNNSNELIFKSKKLSKDTVNKFFLFKNNKIILSNDKGDIIIFSTQLNKLITKFNFYKKKYKKIKKDLNFIINKDIIFVADNIGYLYAYDLIQKRVLWAKNYKIPFRSNLKIIKNKLIVSDLNNSLYFFNINNGDVIKWIPTEETLVKNQFKNSISANNRDTLFFLNSYGSLYSINIESMKINWFININQTLDYNPSNLFLGSQIVNSRDKIIVSSNQNTYIFDTQTGSINNKFNFSTSVRPVISKRNAFFVTKNDLLICIDLNTNKILYSSDIKENIKKFLNTEKKDEIFIGSFMLVNNEIMIFLNNSYLLNFELNGKLKDVKKLPSKISTLPIFIDNSILFLDKKNRLNVVN